jgi:hypothetical protein
MNGLDALYKIYHEPDFVAVRLDDQGLPFDKLKEEYYFFMGGYLRCGTRDKHVPDDSHLSWFMKQQWGIKNLPAYHTTGEAFKAYHAGKAIRLDIWPPDCWWSKHETWNTFAKMHSVSVSSLFTEARWSIRDFMED